MKRSLDHSSGSIKQLDASNSSLNSRTIGKNKFPLNYSPQSHSNNANNYKAGDTILQGYLRSSQDEDQTNNTREDFDHLSSTLDIKLLQKELSLTKKNLKEAQARANVLTHTNSKIQHQNDILEQQTQKAEVYLFDQIISDSDFNLKNKKKRCKELIEKLSSEQLKVNELNFLNKQIQKELDQLRNDNSDTTERMKGNFETLKKKYDEFVEQTESKISKVISQIKKCYAVVGQNDRLHQNRKPDFNQEIFQQLRKVFINIQNILDEKSFDIQDEEINIVQELKNIAMNKDSENMELRAKLQQLQQDFDKESAHTKEILPRYRESLEKLKQNSKLMRDKIKELQESKDLEKQEHEKKIKKIQLNYQQAESEKTQLKNQLNKLNQIMDEEQKESSSFVKEVGHLRKENGILKKKLEEYKGMVDDQESIIVDLKKEIISATQNQQMNQQILVNERVQQKGQRSSSHSPVNTRKEKDELDFYLSKSPSEQEKTRRRKFFEESDEDDLQVEEDYPKYNEKYPGEQNVNPNKAKIQPSQNSNYHQVQQKSKNQYQLDQGVDILSSDESETPAKQKVYNQAQRIKSKESMQNFMTFAESGHTSNNNTFNSQRFEDASNAKFQFSQRQNQNNRSKDLYSFSQSKQGGRSQNNLKPQRDQYDPYVKVNNSYGQDYSSNNYQENDSSIQSHPRNIKHKKGNEGFIEKEIHQLDEEINQIKFYLAEELEILNTEQNQNLYS